MGYNGPAPPGIRPEASSPAPPPLDPAYLQAEVRRWGAKVASRNLRGVPFVVPSSSAMNGGVEGTTKPPGDPPGDDWPPVPAIPARPRPIRDWLWRTILWG